MKPLTRFVGFVREVYGPGLHLAFTFGWFFALALTVAAAGRRELVIDARFWMLTAAGFVALFFLRVVDEWKDEAYDRVHNTDRPLVRGLVDKRDLAIYLITSALVALALAAAVSRAVLAVIALDLVWGAALIVVERASRTIRDQPLANLVVTYPVNVALSVAVVLYVTDGALPDRGAIMAIGAFALAFLHFEVLRKIAWPEAAEPGERLYSRSIGAIPALAIALACAAGAVLLAVDAVGGPTVAASSTLVVPALAAVRFLRGRGKRVRLRPFGMAFLASFYGMLAVTCALHW